MAGYKQIAHLLPEIVEAADVAGERRDEVLRILIDHALSTTSGHQVLAVPANFAIEEAKSAIGKKRARKSKMNGGVGEAKSALGKKRARKSKSQTSSAEKADATAQGAKTKKKSEITAVDPVEIIEIGELPLENVSAFMTTYEVSSDAFKKLYGYTEQGIVGKYPTLGTDKKSEAQVRAAVLRIIANAIANGEFGADMAVIRNEYRDFGILDTNIKVNLERHQKMFSQFDLKNRLELNEDGKKFAAELIKSLA
jgi:hypothetical protein